VIERPSRAGSRNVLAAINGGIVVGLLTIASTALPLPVRAQNVDQVATVPPNVVLANYDNVPVGPYGGLEGSAYVARVSDPSAAWFNPAGLSRQAGAQISGSAGVYEWTAVAPQAIQNSGASVTEQLPNFVGFTFHVRGGLTAGAVLLTTNSWAQEIESERVSSIQNGQERLAYSADSTFSRRIAAVAAGYQSGGGWRAGGGFAFSIVKLQQVQGISDRIADTGLRTVLVGARASGSVFQIRAQGGVQYDTTQFRFGGAVRTPGLTINRNGVLTLDGVLDLGSASLGASLFDADARFDYRLPWEIQGGAAYVRDRAEVEFDIQTYTPISAYSLLSTDHPTAIYGDAGTGSPPTVLLRPFSGLTSESNGVVNVAVGGHFRPFRERDFRVHGGFATSRSPVGDADQVFNKINLSSWTFGASGAYAKLQFAVGFNLRFGTTDDILVRNLLNSDPVHTRVDVRTGGLIYSIAYQF
jgi:hypothetical protein